MDLLDAIKHRRSIRKYETRDVPDEILLKILDAARWAPSACNRQLWEFIIVKNNERKLDIAEKVCFNQSYIKNAPVVIAVYYDDSKEQKPVKGPGRHDAIQSAAAAIQNMILAAHAEGLGALWVCSIKDPEQLARLLNVPRDLRLIALVTLGYPAEAPKVPHRRPMESFIHHEQFRHTQNFYNNAMNPQQWELNELAAFRGRICWFGGTLSKSKTLEKYDMYHPAYKFLIQQVMELHTNHSRILDCLPFGGGYLIGMLQALDKSVLFNVFEMSEGNVDFIKENLKRFRLGEPEFMVQTDLSQKLPSGEAWDVITCFFRVERMPDPVELMNFLSMHLSPNGRILLATEEKGMAGIHQFLTGSQKQNLHQSAWWFSGPQRMLTKGEMKETINRSFLRIVSKRRLPGDDGFKLLSKQILRGRGIGVLYVLEKVHGK